MDCNICKQQLLSGVREDRDARREERDAALELVRGLRAKLSRIMEWMRADQHRQCVCCGTEPPKHDAIDGCYVGDGNEPCKAWTPPKAWEGE